MEFRKFAEKVNEHFQNMMKTSTVMFEVDSDKETIWETYIESFPDGTNEIYITNREHDCSSCRHFIKQFGNVVTIKDGKMESIWDIDIDGKYGVVAKALSDYVHSLPIRDVHLEKDPIVGTKKTGGTNFYHFFAEIVSPDTLEPVEDGVVGELVFTTLTKEGLPLLRYRTKDLTSITHERCECGRTTPRISRFKGRSDDMLIIRGVNVFPSQVESALLELAGTTPHYLMIVDRVNNLDTLEVQVEVEERFFSDEVKELEKLTKTIAKTLQDALLIAVKVKLVEPRTLERSMGKAVRVIDNRKFD